MAAAPRCDAGQGTVAAAVRRASRPIALAEQEQEPILNSNDQYLVDVIGFHDIERAGLKSIFVLAARPDPGFAQYEPGAPGRQPDVYLVDADNPVAFSEYKALHKRAAL